MGLFGLSKAEKALQEANARLVQENARLNQLLLPEQRAIDILKAKIKDLQEDIGLLQKTIDGKKFTINELNTTINTFNNEIEEKKKLISVFDVDIEAQEYGLYKPTFEFANSDLYKDRLKELRDQQKEKIKYDTAAVGSTNWTVDGSVAKGRAMVKDNKKLL
ncbi:MAG: hypothetical protein U0L48_09110, partial [Acutalibacteraceae bacterium]|nr:hypothetical protein [Acutalibacteraceae bacterium]